MRNKTQFGVSTWLWQSPFSTASVALFPKIKSMGFDLVEIPVEDPGLIDPHAVKAALIEYNLQAVVCGVFGDTKDLTHDDTAVHENCFDYIEKCFGFCNDLGVQIFGGTHVFGGWQGKNGPRRAAKGRMGQGSQEPGESVQDGPAAWPFHRH